MKFSENVRCFSITLVVLACLPILSFSPGLDAPSLFLIGDSTMAERKEDVQINPERGWRQVLGQFFHEQIKIENHTVNGRSSESFIDEGRWDKVVKQLVTIE